MMENDGMFRTMGLVRAPGIEPEELIRPDGKELCNYLRSLRMELAAANGIAYQSRKCTYNGPCAGTCPQCDEEIKFLNKKLAEIPPSRRVYPKVQNYKPESSAKKTGFFRKK